MADNNLKNIPVEEATLERVDRAFTNLIDKRFNIHAVTNEGYKKVPVIWLSADRAYHAKKRPDLFTYSTGVKKLPIISVFRDGIGKEPKKAAFLTTIPWDNFVEGGGVPVMRRINAEKTQNFVNAASKSDTGSPNYPTKRPNKVVYETYYAPLPVFCLVKYKLFIATDYLQQLNQCVTPFIRAPGNTSTFQFVDGNKGYEVFFGTDYNIESIDADMSDQERIYKTTISVEVLADLNTNDVNQTRPRLTRTENAVSIAFGDETTIYI